MQNLFRQILKLIKLKRQIKKMEKTQKELANHIKNLQFAICKAEKRSLNSYHSARDCGTVNKEEAELEAKFLQVTSKEGF